MNKPTKMSGTSEMSGMYVCGTVKDRRKRDIIKDDSKIEIITYEIVGDGGNSYYVEAFSPEKYYDRSEYVRIPVYIKAYKKKNGDPAFTINVKSEILSRRGDPF